jgi:4-diphosphocytidyl-2-C-methyl-D-erythritol kinase
LDVLGTRADGFHDIESIFAAFSLCDTLKFEVCCDCGNGEQDDEAVIDTAELPSVFRSTLGLIRLPPEKNLVYRAIKLFKQKTGFDRIIKASVRKRIPPGGGLGGGSSDAAAALVAMNVLGGNGLSVRELTALGATLGGDIPFFVRLIADSLVQGGGGASCSAAFVSGKGDRVESVVCPSLDAVIVNPGLESDTATAFALLDADRTVEPTEKRRLLKQDLLGSLTKNPAEWPFYNDFLPVFLKKPPFGEYYTAILCELACNGAVFSGLSGSGASCFGIFEDDDHAKAAVASLAMRWPFVRYARCPPPPRALSDDVS